MGRTAGRRGGGGGGGGTAGVPLLLGSCLRGGGAAGGAVPVGRIAERAAGRVGAAGGAGKAGGTVVVGDDGVRGALTAASAAAYCVSKSPKSPLPPVSPALPPPACLPAARSCRCRCVWLLAITPSLPRTMFPALPAVVLARAAAEGVSAAAPCGWAGRGGAGRLGCSLDAPDRAAASAAAYCASKSSSSPPKPPPLAPPLLDSPAPLPLWACGSVDGSELGAAPPVLPVAACPLPAGASGGACGWGWGRAGAAGRTARGCGARAASSSAASSSSSSPPPPPCVLARVDPAPTAPTGRCLLAPLAAPPGPACSAVNAAARPVLVGAGAAETGGAGGAGLALSCGRDRLLPLPPPSRASSSPSTSTPGAPLPAPGTARCTHAGGAAAAGAAAALPGPDRAALPRFAAAVLVAGAGAGWLVGGRSRGGGSSAPRTLLTRLSASRSPRGSPSSDPQGSSRLFCASSTCVGVVVGGKSNNS